MQKPAQQESTTSLTSKLTNVDYLRNLDTRSQDKVSDYHQFEKMDLDELHSVQEELKKKIQTTNQLISSRRSCSARSREGSSDQGSSLKSAQKLNDKLPAFSNLNRNTSHSRSKSPKHKPSQEAYKEVVTERSEDRLSRIHQKANKELNSYFDDESRSPSPAPLNDSMNPRSIDTIPER